MEDGEHEQPHEPDQPDCRVERADRAPAVERHDRDQVEEVDEEADEGECDQEVGADRGADRPDRRGGNAAEQRPGEGDLRLLPRVVGKPPHAHDGTEERDEERRRGRDALPPELDDVPELVDEDQKDEAEPEPPAPEQGVGGDRDEHRPRGQEELELEDREEEELELREQRAEGGDRRPDLARKGLPARLRVDRLVVAEAVARVRAVPVGQRLVLGLRLPRLHLGKEAAHAIKRSAADPYDPRPILIAPGRASPPPRDLTAYAPGGQEPLPIHSSPPSYTSFFQSGTSTFRRSMASRHAARASWRCGAEIAIATLGSPMPTRPIRWWIATSQRSYVCVSSCASVAMTCSAMPS